MKTFILCFAFVAVVSAQEQETAAGPVITEYGAVYKVQPDFKVDTDMEHRVVFDVASSPESHDEINALINTPARYLNMQAQSGVSETKMKVAVVIHGGAYKDILTDAVYRERFQTSNPNSGLVRALLSSGVEVILCGQTAGKREISKVDMLPGVQLALSAMNALVQLQSKDYQMIAF